MSQAGMVEKHERVTARSLTPFDVTSLVIGAVIGADIYVVASLGAGLLGPAQLVAWVVGGLMAASIALAFAQCAAIVPEVGGPYAYARHAFGHFPGFIVGWALYLAEWTNLAVLPIAFVRYLEFFFPVMVWWEIALAKAVFMAFLLLTNLFGTRTAGRTNDILTIGKMGPLVVLILAGLAFIAFRPAASFGMLSPFAPLGWSGFGPALILVFWAYAGFELAVIPAGEVIDPPRNLPRAILLGMAISTAFYLLVNAVIVLVTPQSQLVATTTPLADALGSILGNLGVPLILGGGLMAVGAVLSISSADESATLGTSRLGYALAADGYFPRFFARLHPRYGTPYLSLIFQSVTALIVALFGSFTTLITLAVVFLAVAYLATSLASFRLLHDQRQKRLKIPGLIVFLVVAILSSLFLITQAGLLTLAAGAGMLGFGVVVYFWLAPRADLAEVRAELRTQEHRLALALEFLERSPAVAWRWLAHGLRVRG
jgi:basic amino acid/polyamine antiporter, APA family